MTMCEEWQDWIPAYILGAVEPPLRACIEAHLQRCSPCQHLVEDYAPIVEWLAYAPEPVEPSAELRERVLQAIRSECE
jgi:predicted anti-sigma-YlaC factor YlaD